MPLQLVWQTPAEEHAATMPQGRNGPGAAEYALMILGIGAVIVAVVLLIAQGSAGRRVPSAPRSVGAAAAR